MKKEFPSPPSGFFKRSCLCLSAFALLLGGIIYIFFRTPKPEFLHYIRAYGIEVLINSARRKAVSITPFFPDWLIFSLPDGLWAFAYAALITAIWNGSKSPLKYPWMASIPFLVIGFEFLQYLHILPGTFCLQDLAFEIAGLIIGIAIGIKTIKPNNHEKAFE
jgi:hypothetical protein